MTPSLHIRFNGYVFASEEEKTLHSFYIYFSPDAISMSNKLTSKFGKRKICSHQGAFSPLRMQICR